MVGFGAGLTWAAGAIQWNLAATEPTLARAEPVREPELVG